MTRAAGRREAVGDGRLRRVLNTPLLTLYGLGVTVGAGIYVLVGATADAAGPHAPAAFLMAAVVAAFTAFSYAELSTRLPVSAGEAAYVEAAFGKGWLTLTVGLGVIASGTVSAAAVAIGAASYLQGLSGAPQGPLIVGVVCLMTALALWGIAQSVAVAALITVVEVSGLLIVIVWAFAFVEPQGARLAEMAPPPPGREWLGIGAASLLAFFAFVGFEDIANVAEEVKDPSRTLPRAIILTLGLATLLYIGVSTAVLFAVPVEALAASDAPLALVFATAPEAMRRGFGVIAVIATVNGILIQMIMASRVLYGLADQGRLPAALAQVSRGARTPTVATLTVAGVVIALALSLPIGDLARWTAQIVLAVFVLVNAALIRIKLAGPTPAGAFRTPLAVPVLGVASSLLLIAVSLL